MDRGTDYSSASAEAFEGYAVSIGYVQVLFDYMRQRGFAPERICEPARLEELRAADSNTRCAINEWHGLMAAAESLMGDADLALTLAEHCRPWHLGLVGFMAMTSGTLRDVSKVLLRYHHLVNDVESVEASLSDGRFVLEVQQMTSLKSARISMVTLGSWAWLARWLTGRSDLVFDADFDIPQPGRPDFFHRVFGGEVRFNRPQCALRGSTAYGDLRVLQQEPMVNRILQVQAARQSDLTRKKGSGSLLAQLERQLIANLGRGDVSLVAVASEMRISPRTLQSRIDEAGSSFRSILQRVRKYQAINYLGDSRLSLVEIASMLGFANQTSFQHAFKRWTGQSPGEFRRPKSGSSGS